MVLDSIVVYCLLHAPPLLLLHALCCCVLRVLVHMVPIAGDTFNKNPQEAWLCCTEVPSYMIRA